MTYTHSGAETTACLYGGFNFYAIIVTDPRIPVSINPQTVNLKEGESQRVSIEAYKNSTEQIYGATYTYKSNDESIATVDDNGSVTAVKAGTTTITVSYPGTTEIQPATGTITVNVSEKGAKTATNMWYDSSKHCYYPKTEENGVLILDGVTVQITGKGGFNTVEMGATSGEDFEVTSSDENLVQATAVWIPGGNYSKYANFYVTPLKQSTPLTENKEVTLTFRFKGNDNYAACEFSKKFTVVNDVTKIEFEEKDVNVGVGGRKKVNPISTTPAEALQVIKNDITYTVEYTNGATNTLLTVDADGTITSGTEEISEKKNGSDKDSRAVITAHYTNGSEEEIMGYFNAYVRKLGTDKLQFKYGDYYSIDYFENATFVNPFEHGTSFFKFEKYTIEGDRSIVSNLATIENYTSYNDAKLIISGPGTVKVTIHYTDNNSTDEITESYTLVVNPTPENKYVIYPVLVNGKEDETASQAKFYPGASFVVSGVTMTFGGFVNKYGEGTNVEYTLGNSKYTDSYKKPKADPSGIDKDNVYFAGGAQNPMSEDGKNMGPHDGRNSKTTDFQGTNIPVYGTYYKFEPEEDGILRLNVLQTGIYPDSKTTHKKDSHDNNISEVNSIKTSAFYLIDEFGDTQEAVLTQSHSKHAHPYVFVSETKSDGSAYLTDEECNKVGLKQYLDDDLNNNKIYNIKEEFVAAGYDMSNLNAITMDSPIRIMKNAQNGYYTLTESHTEYAFKVKAGKTYYALVNGSKPGINSFEFISDNAAKNTVEIDGSDTESAAVSTDVLAGKANANVTLNRKLNANQPNTMMLPFSVPSHMVANVFGEGTKVLHFKEIDGDKKLHFVRHHHQMINAGEPCIIYPTKSGDSWNFTYVTIPANGKHDPYVEVTSGGYTFTGCFKKETMPAGSYWISTKKGEAADPNVTADVYLYRSKSENWMSNTRAFFKNGGSGVELSAVGIVLEDIDETVTEIKCVQEIEQNATTTQGIFTLDGRKLSDGDSLPKGIYIINGKKTVVK